LKKKKSLQLAPVMVKMPMPAGILGANGDGKTGKKNERKSSWEEKRKRTSQLENL